MFTSQGLLPRIPSLDTPTFDTSFVNSSVNTGSKIKDLAEGALTEMRLGYEKDLAQANAQYATDFKTYQEKFSTLTVSANFARENIKEPQAQKAESIKRVALQVLGIGVIVTAALLTGGTIFALAAIPLAFLASRESYEIYLNHKKTSTLQEKIDAPGKLPVPKKREVSPYNPFQDLDLATTRRKVVRELSAYSLHQLANSPYTISQIVDYELLNEALGQTQKEAFYGKTIQLLKKAKQAEDNKNRCLAKIESEFKKAYSDFYTWKNEQQASLQERRMRIVVPPPVSNCDRRFCEYLVEKQRLPNDEQRFNILSVQLESDLNHEKEKAKMLVNSAYEKAIAILEVSYRK